MMINVSNNYFYKNDLVRIIYIMLTNGYDINCAVKLLSVEMLITFIAIIFAS